MFSFGRRPGGIVCAVAPAAPALIVLAKAPRAGRSKTRLCPPCTPEQAAALAAAALEDTLRAAAVAPAGRHVLVLDGDPAPWRRPGWTVLPQRGDGLDERLAAAFADVGGPAVLIGMDTPQVPPLLLTVALRRLAAAPAVLGPAPDGGFWAVGLRRPRPEAFLGVPMSTAETGAEQRRRLERLALPPAALPALRDVDDIADARAVAATCPGSVFAATLTDLGLDAVAA
jgi:rSAM/selenodomain-associated transferase 1